MNIEQNRRSIGAAVVCVIVVAGMVLPGLAGAAEPWEIKAFAAHTTDEAATEYTTAGGHAFQNSTAFEFTSHPEAGGGTYPNEQLKDSSVALEPGFIGNPAVAPRCPIPGIQDPLINTLSKTDCPLGSRIGTVYATIIGGPQERPIYNMVTERGYPAQFAFRVGGSITVLSAGLLPRTEGYGLTIGSKPPNIASVVSFNTVFCGFGAPESSGAKPCSASSGSSRVPFLTNPLDCSNPQPTWKLLADSWENAGTYATGGLPDLTDPAWLRASTTSSPVTGCDNPALAAQFNAITIATKPLQAGGGPVQADSPSGLALEFDFPQSNDPTNSETEVEPETPQAPEPKDITVKLPAGLSISPSSADGLGACSDQASDPAGDQVRYDSTNPVTCPASSTIGTAVATSPLVALRDPIDDHLIGPEPIPGNVYLLKPHPGDLPVGSGNEGGKLRLLIQLESPGAGINLKLPGVAVADPTTGQLTATFTENPQLPSSHLTVTLKPGVRAPLASPATCGSFQTTTDFVPWSAPSTPDAHPTASFSVGSGPNGTGCSASPGARPFAPTMSAGTESTSAGQSSPFSLRIDRQDGEGELSKLDLTLPDGLSAKLAGITACSDAALATAASRTGAAEQANPTCPGSRIGSVKVGAGPGSDPFYTSGTAYLAGPYKGAPMSAAVVTPAVAGPLDLGTIVVRNALSLDPATAQAHVVSDPLPQIRDGIPLRLRTIIVDLDRPNFTLNPTDCAAAAVNVTITSVDGTSSSPSNHFQADGCGGLDFKPALKLSLKGKVSRRSHPSLLATLNPRPGDANIASAQVRLPKAAFLDNGSIGEVCTRPQFTAHQCPAGSIYGKATATTPLLGYPLAGPVYLRANPAHKLPDLVVGFQGPASQPIEIELAGKTDSVKGALRNTFEAVPDVPVSSFQLELFGGKKGLIEMSTGFCNSPKASVAFTGQNGMKSNSAPKVAAKCPKPKKKSAGKKGRRDHRH